MVPHPILEQYPEMITGQAKQDRLEVKKIEESLGTISIEMQSIQKREQNISQSLQQAQEYQKSFHERVREAGKKLIQIKSLLASHHS